MITINIDPVAFTIGAIEVRWYGIFVALAILVGVLWMLWEVRKGAKLSYNTIFTGALIGIPSGIIFSRLLHVVDRWDIYRHDLGLIIGAEGLTFYGAVLGAAAAIWIYSKLGNFQFGYFADLMAPAILLGLAIGRIGCFINGCCYGIATTLPWGIIYTHPDCLAPLGTPIHPTQVYEIITSLLIFTLLLKLRGRFKPDGSLFLVYLSLYSLWRLGSDFLRVGTPFLLGLHQAQVIAIIVLAITIPILVYRTFR
ncbi:prolipoprotein diacylglyceryl transferase [Dehalococcoidales bacterium]|nr:prolipoprotein diacylglyceryl transferase [Dehalococcoidales bacterium]